MHYIVAACILLVLVAWIGLASGGVSGLRHWLTAGRAVGCVLAVLGAAGLSVAYVRMPRPDAPSPRFDSASGYVLPPPAARPSYVPFPVADAPPGSASPPASVPAAAPVRVRLKVAANLRKEPSQTARVVRAAKSGDVLIRFAESNGWLQVGADHPEGWVSRAVLGPAG